MPLAGHMLIVLSAFMRFHELCGCFVSVFFLHLLAEGPASVRGGG